MRQCEVYLHGIKAGMLTEEDNGEYTFIYDSSYLEKGDCPSVSLTLPLREEPYRSTVLFPFFFNGYGTYGIIVGGGQQYTKVIFGIDVQ